MNFSIRPVQDSDATAISELLNAIIATGKYTILEGPFTPQAELEFIQSFPTRGVFLVAEREDGRILGCQNVSPASSDNALRHVGIIGTFIAMDVQGQGVGRALASATFTAARAQGFEKLTAMIRADNPRAIGFYVSQGFRIVGTMQRHAVVDGRYVDEVLAEKHLIPVSLK